VLREWQALPFSNLIQLRFFVNGCILFETKNRIK
jgi:hypothetical protein